MTPAPLPAPIEAGFTARTRSQLRTLGAILLLSAGAGGAYGAGLSLTWGVGSVAENVLQGVFSSVLISLLCGGADVFVLSNPRMRTIRRMPFLAFVALRAAVYAVGIIIGLRAPARLLSADPETLWSFSDPLFVQTFLISLAIAFCVALTIEISRLLGPGVLPALITGRYHRPRREERVFLFADIEGSTALAERIGDLEFHRFLAAVFSDWAEPVSAARGETHRYVGDEIIVTWPLARGVKKARCLSCVFAMETALTARAEWYMREFGHVPRFRAALHCGSVVTGEMGDQRKEIVFLGDTVNTTSRMQAACRDRGVHLILSGALADRLPADPRFTLRALGVWTPRGKSREVRLFTAERAA
jgi:class 3 adenylate cyclase